MLEKLEKLDREIKKHSFSSHSAPPYFIEPEIRRQLNSWHIRDLENLALNYNRYRDTDFELFIKDFEKEFLCYFETDKFKENLRFTGWWKYVYAGCNAQIEYFLIESGLADALEILGFGESFAPVEKIKPGELPEEIEKYLIGIGYLYPKEGEFIIHPNMLIGQSRRGTADSSFLTRDLIRCPYHVACGGKEPLSNEEMWGYWSDLLALTYADLPEHIHYSSEDFKDPSKIRDSRILEYLEIGRKLVPQRYVELESQIEEFDWYIPPNI